MTSLINRDLMRSRVSTEVVPTLHRLVTAAEAIAENNPFGIPPPATDGPTIVSPHPMSQVVLAMATLRSKCTLAARPLTGLARSAYSQVKVYENVLDCLRDARNGKPPSGPFDADFLFLGTTQLVQLVDGARALEGTLAGGLIAKSHINAIADLFFDVASERLALVASYVRGSRGMDPETRGVLELGRMPYQPRFGISALEWESCRNISKALDNCARQVPGSAAFYLALEDVHTISMRVWDPNLGLSEPTINNALSAIADHVQFLPDIASALRTVTGRDLLLPPGVYC